MKPRFSQDEKGLLAKAFVVSLAMILTGCLVEGQLKEDDTNGVADPEEVTPPLTTPAQTICDPFNVGATARDRGIIGNLVYLEDSQPRYTRASDYIANGIPVQSTLYFDKLFIPTRRFDLGFYTQEGQLVLNANNQPLYEYFGLRLETQLMLGEVESEGWYQLAMLSDDGSILSQKNSDGSLTTLVDNDGTHPTRMGCSQKAIYMQRSTKLPVVLDYYQGPRFHISLVALWRPLPEGQDPHAATVDSQCGRQGNSMYFDSNQTPSAPTATYYEMLTRGWKPLGNENFRFPTTTASNPCAQESPLLLTSFAIVRSTPSSITVNWSTSIAASSQVQVRNIQTGQMITSPVEASPKTSHQMSVTGLSANTLYAVRAISQSPGGQSVLSDERAIRTPR